MVGGRDHQESHRWSQNYYYYYYCCPN